jgi:hypothetical protein
MTAAKGFSLDYRDCQLIYDHSKTPQSPLGRLTFAFPGR